MTRLLHYKTQGVAIVVLLLLTSCGQLSHSNFNRQKYLHGRIAPSYAEEQTLQVKNENSKSEKHARIELSVAGQEDSVSTEKSAEFVDFILEIEAHPELNKPVELVDHPQKIAPDLEKILLKKRTIPLSKSQKLDSSFSIHAILILIILALFALPFAFLIGFWAFIIAGALLTAAAIILVSTDVEGSGDSIAVKIISSVVLLIVLIALLALICVAAVIALIWFIVWGIVQLVN